MSMSMSMSMSIGSLTPSPEVTSGLDMMIESIRQPLSSIQFPSDKYDTYWTSAKCPEKLGCNVVVVVYWSNTKRLD